MVKVIEFLVYTFTNRLTKVITITLNDGIPTEDEKVRLKDFLTKEYKTNVTLLFTSNQTPFSITETFIKNNGSTKN